MQQQLFKGMQTKQMIYRQSPNIVYDGPHSHLKSGGLPQYVDFSLTQLQAQIIKAKLPKEFMILNPNNGDLDKIKGVPAKNGQIMSNVDRSYEKGNQKNLQNKEKPGIPPFNKKPKIKETHKINEHQEEDKNKKVLIDKKKHGKNNEIKYSNEIYNDSQDPPSEDEFQIETYKQTKKHVDKQKQKIKDGDKDRVKKQKAQVPEPVVHIEKQQIAQSKIFQQNYYTNPHPYMMNAVPIPASSNEADYYSIPMLASTQPRYIPQLVDYQNEDNSQANMIRIQFGLPNRILGMQNAQKLNQKQKNFCINILQKLRSHKSSQAFRVRVDPVAQGVPDYHYAVYNPMDLQSIYKKVTRDRYDCIAEFHADINRIFLNSYKYNLRETTFFQSAIQFEDYYHSLLKDAEEKPQEYSKQNIPKTTKPKKTEQYQEVEFTEQSLNKKKKRPSQQNIQQNLVKSQSQINQKQKNRVKVKNVYEEGALSNSMIAERVNQFNNEAINPISADSLYLKKIEANKNLKMKGKPSWDASNQFEYPQTQSIIQTKSLKNKTQNYVPYPQKEQIMEPENIRNDNKPKVQLKNKQKQQNQRKEKQIQLQQKQRQLERERFKQLEYNLQKQHQNREQLQRQLEQERQMRLSTEYSMHRLIQSHPYHHSQPASQPIQMQQDMDKQLIDFKFDLTDNTQQRKQTQSAKEYVPPPHFGYPIHSYYPYAPQHMQMMPESYSMHAHPQSLHDPQMMEYGMGKMKVRNAVRNDDYNDDDEIPEHKHDFVEVSRGEEAMIDQNSRQGMGMGMGAMGINNMSNMNNMNMQGYQMYPPHGMYPNVYPYGHESMEPIVMNETQKSGRGHQNSSKMIQQFVDINKTQSINQEQKQKQVKAPVNDNAPIAKSSQQQQQTPISNNVPSSKKPSFKKQVSQSSHPQVSYKEPVAQTENLPASAVPQYIGYDLNLQQHSSTVTPTNSNVMPTKTKNITKAPKTKKKVQDQQYRCSSEDEEYAQVKYEKKFVKERLGKMKFKSTKQSKSAKQSSNSAEVITQKKRGRQQKNRTLHELSAQNSENDPDYVIKSTTLPKGVETSVRPAVGTVAASQAEKIPSPILELPAEITLHQIDIAPNNIGIVPMGSISNLPFNGNHVLASPPSNIFIDHVESQSPDQGLDLDDIV